MKTCIKCGGSWTGREFDTLCEHDFAEPPEPECVSPCALPSRGEFGFAASGFSHPTRAGAIAAYEEAWRVAQKRERWAQAYGAGKLAAEIEDDLPAGTEVACALLNCGGCKARGHKSRGRVIRKDIGGYLVEWESTGASWSDAQYLRVVG